MIVLLGKGALSMFLTISAHENLPLVLVSLAEEDLLDPDETDFSSGKFASGKLYLEKCQLNLRRVFLEHTIFQPSSDSTLNLWSNHAQSMGDQSGYFILGIYLESTRLVGRFRVL